MSISADHLTFGIEVECCIKNPSPILVGGYHHGYELRSSQLGSEYAPLDGWNTQNDASISPPVGHFGCEFVSPVLTGREGLTNAFEAVKCIKETVKGKVNSSCGVHVHVGFPGDVKALKRLVHLVACHQKALYAITGTPRRQTSRWCQGIKDDYTPEIEFIESRYHRGLSCSVPGADDRYKILNLQHILSGRRKTVEFRQFSESNNPKKIVAWVRLCLALVERALNGKKPVKWDSKDFKVVDIGCKKGDGFKSFKLLCYKIGWVRGRCYETVNGERIHRTYGGSMDNIPGLPTMWDDRSVLKNLCNKYDEKWAQMIPSAAVA